MSSTSKLPDAVSATKITYIDGRPTTITLRRCKLVVSTGDADAQEHVFDKDVITIGAMEDNDLVLDDETVSRNHCKIFVEGDYYLISDLGSTNGTFVNRVRVREAFLRPNYVVTLGKSEINFVPVDEKLRIVPSDKERFGDLIGRDAKMREVYAILEKIGRTDATVIIEGETGTGKEIVARTIHQQSAHRSGPFIVFDCGAVPENLIESELFGHEKGSFTGAMTSRQGMFEMANGGTLFLDELGELALDLQPKLLRALEQREVKRVGGSRPIKVDVRIVAATNRKLKEEVKAGRFREDLYYRLSVVRILLPSLRERKDDLPLLVSHFLNTCSFNFDKEGSQRVVDVDPRVWDQLNRYNWPGNVRELLNVVERAVSFADSSQLRLEDLPQHLRSSDGSAEVSSAASTKMADAEVDVNDKFKEAKERWVETFERDYIATLLRRNQMNISHAARDADIDRKYLRKLMKKHEITTDDLSSTDTEA